MFFKTLLVALTCSHCHAYELQATKTWSDLRLTFVKVAIAPDAGHGGPDGGASSKEGVVLEKDINLAITLHLRDYLQQAGALVVMTRETDTDSGLSGTKGYSRRKIEYFFITVPNSSMRENADLFLSVQFTPYLCRKWRGAQCFILRE